MDEAQFMHGFNGERDLSHVETGDVLGENLIFDQHGHQVTTGKKLHEHVEEGAVLEGGMQLDNPRAVGLGENISLGADVGQLVLLELIRALAGVTDSVWRHYHLMFDK